jgi:serine/threonine protein phosphatase 1
VRNLVAPDAVALQEAFAVSQFAHFSANARGRDFAVGDIHGHFYRLQEALDQLGFDPAVDRLFSVGDLVDRGPDSTLVLEWLQRPWFFAVQGNHEVLTLQYMDGHPQLNLLNYRQSGGGWFMDSPPALREQYAERFRQLPVALEVETPRGLVGLVHADCPFPSWNTLRSYLQHTPLKSDQTSQEPADEVFQWSRGRLKRRDFSGIKDVRAVVVGHTPLRRARRLGNVFHIDTAGWSEGFFTFIELRTLDIHEQPLRGDRAAAPQG